MSGQDERRSSWATGFVPGLVMGLVIGAFVGAVLPPLLSANKLPDRAPGSTTSAGDRDREQEMDRDGEGLPTEDAGIEEPGQTGIPEGAGSTTEPEEISPTEGETDDSEG